VKLPVSTWILIVLTLGLGSFVYYREVYNKPKQQILTTEAKKLFNFPKEEIKGITIERPRQKIELVKTARKINAWQMKKPEDVVANTGAVIFLVELLLDSQIDRTLTISSNQLAEYGLDKPTAKIIVLLQNSRTQTLILGRVSFDDRFIYGYRSDGVTQASEITLLLLPKTFQEAVTKETKEWQNKDLTEEDKKIEMQESIENNKPKNKSSSIEENKIKPVPKLQSSP
jgi:hypothetical protein